MALGLYLHIPFCLQKCNYCDFVSYPITGGNQVEVFLQCLAREMELCAQELGREEKKLASLYLGGGTPTCLATGQLVRVLEHCRHFFSWINGIEVTVEANPGTLSREKLQTLKKSGVNRLSLGAQSFDAGLLAAMGRQHRAEDVMEAVSLAREAGFDNLNLDLIYGLPGQTLGQWEETLSKALSLQVEHLSVYGLILEPNTPWGQMVEEGILTTVDDELALAMYNLARIYLHRAGYEHYEISNFARQGFYSKHNCRYWLNQHYLGLGPAASSWLEGKRWTNLASLSAYISCLQKEMLPVAQEIELDLHEEMVETVILGLRLVKGMDLQAFHQRFRMDLFSVFPEQVHRLTSLGLLEEDRGYLRLTSQGLPLANFVWQEFA